MRKLKRWVLPAILIGGMVSILTACKNNKSVNEMSVDEIKEKVRAFYGENKEIKDGNYDKSLAVKCISVPRRGARLCRRVERLS